MRNLRIPSPYGRGTKGEGGTALVLTVLFSAVFAVLVTTIYALMRTTLEDAFHQKKQAQAFALAEAGLADGFLAVKNSAFCASTAPYTLSLDYGSYRVRLGPVLDVSVASAVARSDPAAIEIASTGTVSGVLPWGSVQRSLVQRVEPRRTTAVNGIFASTGAVTFGVAAVIDSYDSRVELEPVTFGASATVTTNGAFGFAQDAAAIRGDALYAALPAPTTTQATGHRGQLAAPATFWILVSTTDLACASASGISPGSAYDSGTRALNASGAVTIAPGLYHFSSVTVGPAGSLTTSGTGRVDIHLAGGLTAQGPIVNTGKKPSDLVIQGVSGVTDQVRLEYDATFFGVLVVSSQPVILGSLVRYFGGITAASLTLAGGAAVHYDLALSTKTAVREGVYLGELSAVSWRANN